MSTQLKRALVTCEITDDFLLQLRDRGFEVKWDGWGRTGINMDKQRLITILQNCDVAFVELESIDREVIENCPSLRFIGVARGTPVNIDLDLCSERGITVASTPARNADAVADYCLAMMIVASRAIFPSVLHLKKRRLELQGPASVFTIQGSRVTQFKCRAIWFREYWF